MSRMTHLPDVTYFQSMTLCYKRVEGKIRFAAPGKLPKCLKCLNIFTCVPEAVARAGDEKLDLLYAMHYAEHEL